MNRPEKDAKLLGEFAARVLLNDIDEVDQDGLLTFDDFYNMGDNFTADFVAAFMTVYMPQIAARLHPEGPPDYNGETSEEPVE